MIRGIEERDAKAVCEIYNHYVANTAITFEEEPVAEEEMARRIAEISSAYPWLAYEEGGSLMGYAYASKWKARSAYRSSVELSVYVSKDALGAGIGKALYRELVDRLKAMGVHAIVGGMALPNERSQGLHESMGFEKVAEFKEIGNKFGKWVDVGYWELRLNG